MTRTAIAIRPATPADTDAMAAVYNQGIAERQATFETAERDGADALQWVTAGAGASEPVLVAERDGTVLGFARVIRSSDRCAYVGVGEYTIYLDRDARGHGIGRQLLDALATAAEAAGYWKLIGKLFTGNEASIGLARRCGFREVGIHERHGRLDGEWKGVLLVERLLGEATVP